MVTVVGRIRKDAVLENGIKYVLVSHNIKMGAAKGALLVAELLIQEGYSSWIPPHPSANSVCSSPLLIRPFSRPVS